MTEESATDGGIEIEAASEVGEDVRAIVEDTELPERLRRRLYRAIADREEATTGEIEDVVRAVEAQYVDTRVDPLDPVGTVSAQSIGEPGTQMSIPADEQVILNEGDETRVRAIGPLVDEIMADREVRTFEGHEVAKAPRNLAVPSLDDDETVAWQPVEEVSRHEAPEELLQFELESGRTIRATKAHSFVTRRDNKIVPVAGDSLETGDWLPVVADLEGTGTATIDLRRHLPTDAYRFTSALTDGGTATTRATLEDGRLEREYAYPVDETVGLPESLPLDEQTGFVVGAWLAAGSLSDAGVTFANLDAAGQERVRAFADRFDLPIDEAAESGRPDQALRIAGTILADLLEATCHEDGAKRIPGFAIGAEEAFVEALLRGYFSAAGSLDGDAVQAEADDEWLLAGIALLLSRVGVHANIDTDGDSRTLRVPQTFVPQFAATVGMDGEREERLAALAADAAAEAATSTDRIPNVGDALTALPGASELPSDRQAIPRNRLKRLVSEAAAADVDSAALAPLRAAVEGDVVWDRIVDIETVHPEHEYVYDLSVAGLETFTTAEGVITHNTMNTFHYAGVAEIDVTQGLPRLIELVDARKTPDTPMMTVHLEEEYATERERTHEVVWQIEATKILALGDISTNVADMVVQVDLNEETLQERWPTIDETEEIATEIASTIESKLGVETQRRGTVVQFGPDEPSYRELLQLVEELRDIVFKGIEDISRVVIRKEDLEDRENEEFVLYTEGSAFGDVLDIEGVDASRTTCNNIHEIYKTLGVEAAREAIINETMDTLEEQGLGNVNIRHLMLVADIMTNTGEIQSIGRHGISGSKDSVLARAAFEVTVSHLLDAAVYGEVDDLDGVTENVIVGKPIKLGTGDVNLRMRAGRSDGGESADD